MTTSEAISPKLGLISSSTKKRHFFLCSTGLYLACALIEQCNAQWLLTSAHNVTDACAGNGILISVGWNSGGIQASNDGITWSLKTSKSGKGICYGNGSFWIIAPGNELLRTTDGSNVVTVATNFSSDDIAYGNGLLVSIDNFSGIRYSQDGVNWTSSLSPVEPYSGGKIYFLNGLFVASSRGNLMTSSDGKTWAIKASDIYSYPTAATYGSNGFLVLSSDGTKSWSSLDGNNWTVSAIGPGFAVNSLHFANGKYFAAGASGRVSVSSNGINWTRQSTGVTFTLEALTSIGETIVAGGNQVIRNVISPPADNSPSLNIYQAVEIEFMALNGVAYTIEGSVDLIAWVKVEGGIFGSGAMVKRLYSIRDQPNRYFRVKGG
jgi:hypothetical protein